MTSCCQAKEIVSSRCRNCNRESAAENFCRWCGVYQGEGTYTLPVSAERETNRTTVLGRPEMPRSISGTPLNALTQKIAVKTGSIRMNRCTALVIAVLVAIPMWLLIVLLSPFDAYVSAKAAFSQMDIR
jgi:hypothetical protein